MTLNGIDVSRWQATTPNLAGLSFLFARATYGTFVDPAFDRHIAAARKAGLVTGAYHFARATPVADQVRAFLANSDGADLFALDLERDGNAQMSAAEARDFISRVQHTGRKIGLYHSESGFTDLGQDFDWIANWSQVPSRPWDFHQYRGSPLDLDHYRGTLAQLRALAGKALPAVVYRVSITGPTRLYTKVGGTPLPNGVSLATYNAVRVKSGGDWWYRITGTGVRNGQAFKPGRFTHAEVL